MINSKVRWCPRRGIKVLKFFPSAFQRQSQFSLLVQEKGPARSHGFGIHPLRMLSLSKTGKLFVSSRVRLLYSLRVFEPFKQEWIWEDIVFSSEQHSPGFCRPVCLSARVSDISRQSYQPINLPTYLCIFLNYILAIIFDILKNACNIHISCKILQ